MTTTHTLTLPTGPVEVTVTDRGHGHPFLLLHGGGGPQTMAGFADLLAAAGRVISPVHPGFGGTVRPDGFTSVAGLAALYADLLAELDLTGVTVIGNSIGGWIAAELALLGSPRISGVVLVNAVGIEVPGHPIADVFALTPEELAPLSFHDPDRFRVDPASLPPAVQATLPGNRAALATYGGARMLDPGLAGRLAAVTTPTLVVWGESDRVVDSGYGRAFAAAIPGARFELLTGAGHLPQLEAPQRLLDLITDFTGTHHPAG